MEEEIRKIIEILDGLPYFKWERLKKIIDDEYKSNAIFKVPKDKLETFKNYLEFQLK